MDHLLGESRGLVTLQLGVCVGFAHGVACLDCVSTWGVRRPRRSEMDNARVGRWRSIRGASGMGGRPAGRPAHHTSRCMVWCRGCSSRFRVCTAPRPHVSALSPSAALDCPPLSLAVPLGDSDGYPFLPKPLAIRAYSRAFSFSGPWKLGDLNCKAARRAMSFSICDTATSIRGARLS